MELTRIQLDELLRWTKDHHMHLQRYVLTSKKQATQYANSFIDKTKKISDHIAMVV